MLRRLFLILCFLCFLLPTVSATTCYFDVRTSDCERFSSPFNEFSLSFSPDDFVTEYNAVLYHKENPSNRLQVVIEDTIVRNVNPFVESGVYTLEVRATTKSGLITVDTYDVVFDRSTLAPPLVDFHILTSGSTALIQGKALVGLEVVADAETGVFTTQVDEEGTFELSIPVNSGYTLVDLYTREDAKTSARVTRMIHSGSPLIPQFVSSISGISLANPLNSNEKTYLDNGVYYTASQSFFVTGTLSGSLAGTVVFMNGERVLADAQGRFGGFVLLNEGLNTIEVFSGGQQQTLEVFYTVPRFQFETVAYDKVTSSQTLPVDVEMNIPLPFSVYLNGDEVLLQEPTGTSTSFVVDGLSPGKNYITLHAVDGTMYSDIIYVDAAIPTIEYVSSPILSNGNEIVFRVQDDISVDLNSFTLTIGPYEFSGTDVDVQGDFILVDITEVLDGSYTASVSLLDLVGNQGTFSTSLTLDSQSTLIERLRLASGESFGSLLFVQPGEQHVTLIPSRFIAFDKIFVDGEEQLDYEIKANGDVEATLTFGQTSGTLEMSFMNSDEELFTQTFTYFTDDEKPQVELDYVYGSSGTEDHAVIVTGSLTDSYVDWDSFTLNGASQFLRFGDHFEAYVPLEQSEQHNLIISAQDYAGNGVEESIVGGLLYRDDAEASFFFTSPFNGGFEGAVLDESPRVDTIAYQLNGFSSQDVFLSSSFSVGIDAREGVQTSLLTGFESSGNHFQDQSEIILDGSLPIVYVFEGVPGVVELVIDGTYSAVDVGSLQVSIDGVLASALSNCIPSTFVGYYVLCRSLPIADGQTLQITVSDEASNEATRTFTVGTDTYDELSSVLVPMKVYIAGAVDRASEESVMIQGQVQTASPLTSVHIEGQGCTHDENHFVCEVELTQGNNQVEIEATNTQGQEASLLHEIEFISDETLEVLLEELQGAALYNVDGVYYTTLPSFDLLGSLSQDAVITLLLDDREILFDKQQGQFTFDVDVGLHGAGKNSDDIVVELVATDEIGNRAISEQILVVWNRIAETLVDIVIG